MTDDSPTCPHCDADLTDQWITASVDYPAQGLPETEMRCPNCGKDMTRDHPEGVVDLTDH